MASIKFTVDGKAVTVNADPNMPLLYALRNDLKMTNPHFGCGLAQCGACTGSPSRCTVQAAYVEEQVPQCGYCINGWIMTAAAFLKKNPKATDGEIREALAGLKCRCATHVAILRAIKRAQSMMA